MSASLLVFPPPVYYFVAFIVLSLSLNESRLGASLVEGEIEREREKKRERERREERKKKRERERETQKRTKNFQKKKKKSRKKTFLSSLSLFASKIYRVPRERSIDRECATKRVIKRADIQIQTRSFRTTGRVLLSLSFCERFL